MATEKYPQRNVNVPMNKRAVEAARARLAPGRPSSPMQLPPSNGRGSRREIAPGQWIDDRVIEIGGRSSPSKDTPPEMPAQKAVPATFDPLKVYEVVLLKSVEIDGRWRSPSHTYQMVGAVAEAHRDSIFDAVELGDIPVDPDAPPSPDVTPEPEATKAKKKA